MEKKGQDVAVRASGLHVVLDIMTEVERVIREELDAHPRFADIHNRLGLVKLKRGDLNGARVSFEKALSINKDYVVARLNVGYVLLELEDLAGCERVLSEKVTGEEKGLALNAIAVLRLRQGRFPEAQDLLAEAQSLEPRNAIYSHNLALALFMESRIEDATNSLRHVEKLCPPYSELFQEAMLFGEGKLSPDAFRDYVAQQEMNPNLSEVHDHLGHAYASNGLYREAEAEYRMSLRTMPSLANYYCNLALLSSAQDKEQEALMYNLKAVDAEPDSVKARIALAFEYSARGLAPEAMKQFEAARELKPSYPDVRYNLGLLYLELGRHDDAVAEFKASLDCNPKYLFARNSLAFALFKSQSFDAALVEYKKVLGSGLCSSDILVNVGIIYREKGDLSRALDSLTRATQINPDYASAYYHLGQVYQALGQKEKARRAWRSYLDRAREDVEAEDVRKALEREQAERHH